MKQFNIGLTGLTTHQRALETSANNIANASTVAYKSGEYLFADQFSTFLSQTDAGKVGQGAQEIGVRRNFAQGAFRKTGSQFDVAISGEGMLVTSPIGDGTGQKFLTRNGQLAVDKNRMLINSNGQFVYGRATYASTGETSSNDLVAMTLPPETIEPQKTIDAKLQFNLNRNIEAPVTRASMDAYRTTRFDFNPKDPSSFDYQTSVTVFDSVGEKHELRYYFRREEGLAVNQWAMYTYVDDYAMQLDSSGSWTPAKPELDPSTGMPRRDVRGAILESVYETGSLSDMFTGTVLTTGVDAGSLLQSGVKLASGLTVASVVPGTSGVTGVGALDQTQVAGKPALTMTIGGIVYTTEGIDDNTASQTLHFDSAGGVRLATITLTGAGTLSATQIADQLTSAPETSSLSVSGVEVTSVNFGAKATNGALFQIGTSAPTGVTAAPDTLYLQIFDDVTNTFKPSAYSAFVGNDLASGKSATFAFTDPDTNNTMLTVNVKNPTNATILKSTSGGVTGLQTLLTQSANNQIEAKLSSVRRPQAQRYIFEVDPTTGRMLDSLDNPVAKIFSSLPNGHPDMTAGVSGLIPKLSPSFKYSVKLGADANSTREGVPFGATSDNPLIDFEVSQFEGTSVASANAQTKSVQVGGRSLSRLTGMTIDPGGRLVASYSNGDITYGGRLALAIVPSQGGLIPVGSNLYQESFFSGASTLGNPGDAGFGTIRSETVEDSNLDLAQELVKLTQLQRIYQANAKTISSADELIQSLLNIR